MRTACSAIILYVDDVHISCAKREEIEKFVSYMKGIYGNITESDFGSYTYLGIYVDTREKGMVKLSCRKYIKDLLAEHYEEKKKYATPASADLFERDKDDVTLDKSRSEKYHSVVAKLLYISIRVRVDIALAVSYLATRVSGPSDQDEVKLNRVLGYLGAYPDAVLMLRGDLLPDQIHVYCDASFASHDSKKSHTGIYITLGLGPVLVKSLKQKLVSKSSTEAEIYSMSAVVSIAIGMSRFLSYQGINLKIIKVFEDNKSVIDMVRKGRPNTDATRHISIHNFFIKQYVDEGIIDLKYMPTEDMLADAFTKPLQGSLFKRMVSMMGLKFLEERSVEEPVRIKGCVRGPEYLEPGRSNPDVVLFSSENNTEIERGIQQENSLERPPKDRKRPRSQVAVAGD